MFIEKKPLRIKILTKLPELTVFGRFDSGTVPVFLEINKKNNVNLAKARSSVQQQTQICRK